MNLNEMQQKDYRSIPFYSLNDELEEGRLREQIRFMHKQGIGGFFLHARGGLETEYLSEEWFRLMEAAVDEAKKLGMDVWFYDENGWPSGFAGGELLKEGNYVAYLELKEWSAAYVDADPEQIGLKGSPTKVKGIVNVVFQAKESKRMEGKDQTALEDLVKDLIANHTIG